MMLRMIDLMRIVCQWHEKKNYLLNSDHDVPNTAEDQLGADDISTMYSRSPQTMTRADVQTDMAGMMHSFNIDLNILPHYRDELLEAENACAACAAVGRCHRWKHEGRRGDAPELFCPNVKLFSELAVDPFWTKKEVYDWPDDPTALPWLRVLEVGSREAEEHPPDLRSGKLQAFAKAAAKIDWMAREWAPHIKKTEDQENKKQLRRKADLEMASAIEEVDNMKVDDFRSIYYVALSDSDIAGKLRRLLEQRVRAEGA